MPEVAISVRGEASVIGYADIFRATAFASQPAGFICTQAHLIRK